MKLTAELPEAFRLTTVIEFLVGSGDVLFCVDNSKDIEPLTEPKNCWLYDVVMCSDSIGVSNTEATATLGPMISVGRYPVGWLACIYLMMARAINGLSLATIWI